MSTITDFLDELKYKISDTWYKISEKLGLSDLFGDMPTDIIKAFLVPVLTIILAVYAIFQSNASVTKANNLEGEVENYNGDISSIEFTFDGIDGAEVDSDIDELNARSDLMLQYSALSSISDTSTFSTMESMAACTETEEENVSETAISEYIDQIVEFAGQYGGALIENTVTSIKLAAYENSEDMESPASGVSNILVSHLTQTVSGAYDKSDTIHTLLLLSGTDITNISSIAEGSVMYTYFGDTDSSDKDKSYYTCVATETGYLNTTSDDEDEVEDEDDENGVVSRSTSEDESADEEESLNEESIDIETTEEESSLEEIDDDGLIVSSSSAYDYATVSNIADIKSDGTVVYEDGTIVSPSGTVTYSDGTMVYSDGTVVYPDGMIVYPDGTIGGGTFYSTIQESEDSSSSDEDSETTDDEDDEDNEDNDDDEDDDDEDADNDENEDDEDEDDEDDDDEHDYGKDSDITQNVFDSDGNLLSENTEYDLILYSVNSKTKTVIITYWNEN